MKRLRTLRRTSRRASGQPCDEVALDPRCKDRLLSRCRHPARCVSFGDGPGRRVGSPPDLRLPHRHRCRNPPRPCAATHASRAARPPGSRRSRVFRVAPVRRRRADARHQRRHRRRAGDEPGAACVRMAEPDWVAKVDPRARRPPLVGAHPKAQPRGLGFYSEFMRPNGLRDMLKIWLASDDHSVTCIQLWRHDRDFSRRDQDVLGVLQQDLIRLHAVALAAKCLRVSLPQPLPHAKPRSSSGPFGDTPTRISPPDWVLPRGRSASISSTHTQSSASDRAPRRSSGSCCPARASRRRIE